LRNHAFSHKKRSNVDDDDEEEEEDDEEEDEDEENAAIAATREFICKQLIRMAPAVLANSDDAGRNTLFAVLRELLCTPSDTSEDLSEQVLKLLLQMFVQSKKGSAVEFSRLMLEIISDTKDTLATHIYTALKNLNNKEEEDEKKKSAATAAAADKKSSFEEGATEILDDEDIDVDETSTKLLLESQSQIQRTSSELEVLNKQV